MTESPDSPAPKDDEQIVTGADRPTASDAMADLLARTHKALSCDGHARMLSWIPRNDGAPDPPVPSVIPMDKKTFDDAAQAMFARDKFPLPEGTEVCRESELSIGDYVLGYWAGSPAWLNFRAKANCRESSPRTLVVRRKANATPVHPSA